jgi:small nuclear ribonucleoprotein (snRNP)-like protein
MMCVCGSAQSWLTLPGLSGTMSLSMVNPKPFLKSMMGRFVVVKLKWGMQYRGAGALVVPRSVVPHHGSAGKLGSVDQYFNVQVSCCHCSFGMPCVDDAGSQLFGAEEQVGDAAPVALGEILIRCVNFCLLHVGVCPSCPSLQMQQRPVHPRGRHGQRRACSRGRGLKLI